MNRHSLKLCNGFFLATATCAALISCGQNTGGEAIHSQRNHGATDHRLAVETPSLMITDLDSRPIAGAKIQIGPREGSPFPGNLIVTDVNGAAPIPSGWIDAQPITIDAAGFVRATYIEQPAITRTFKLRRTPSSGTFELKGETSGFPNLRQDGILDVGLVVPAFKRRSIPTLQITSLISPQSDTISALGKKFQLPSNISIPKQTESYVLPITFNKPVYRMYFPGPETYQIAAINARFPLREIIDGKRAGLPFTDLINKFNFVSAGLKTVSVREGSTAQPLTVSSISFTPTIPVTAPNFDPSLTMISVSLPEKDGEFYASDVKRLAPRGRVTLKAPTQVSASSLVASLLSPQFSESSIGADSEQISVTLTPANSSQAFEFLDLAQAPELHSGSLILHPPRAITGVKSAITHVVLSAVEVIDGGDYQLEKLTPLWDIYASEWAQRIDLPIEPDTREAHLRWAVTFIGQSETSAPTPLGPDAFEKATHTSRSAVDIR